MASPDPKFAPLPASGAADRRPAHAESPSSPQKPAGRRKWPWIVGLIFLVVFAALAIPWLRDVLTTVSTDDAYVNGHLTFVAPRVNGQVKRVLVDDNNMV